MSKYIDAENFTIDWEPADMAEYGDTFEGGVLYVLDALSKMEEDGSIAFPKRTSKRALKNYCVALSNACDRWHRRADTLAVQMTTYRDNAELLEKICGLFRPSEEETDTVRIDNLHISAGFLRFGLARPWAFTEAQAERFIELVEEMHERNTEEWHRRWEDRLEETLNEKDSDSL